MLVWVVQHLRQYTLYYTLHLLSKAYPLCYLLEKPTSIKSIAKWQVQLVEYDIQFVPCMLVKGQALANCLAEFPIDDWNLINSELLDDGIMQVESESDNEPC